MPPIDDSIMQEPEIRTRTPVPEEQPQYVYYQPQEQPFIQDTKKDIFSDLDRTAYIIIFVSFILGFFMGKTMQPVILRQ